MKYLEHTVVSWRDDGDVFFENARRRLGPSWPLSHTHVCACKVRHAGKTDQTETNVRATRCSVYTSRRLQGELLFSVSELVKNTFLNSLTGHRGSLHELSCLIFPSDRLATECLSTSPATMRKKRTMLLRSTFSKLGLLIPIAVDVFFFGIQVMAFHFSVRRLKKTILLLLCSLHFYTLVPPEDSDRDFFIVMVFLVTVPLMIGCIAADFDPGR